MEFFFEGKKYEILIATDDCGVRCELWDLTTNSHLIDIFKNESLKKIEFHSTGMPIPFTVLEKVLENFYSKIGIEFS